MRARSTKRTTRSGYLTKRPGGCEKIDRDFLVKYMFPLVFFFRLNVDDGRTRIRVEISSAGHAISSFGRAENSINYTFRGEYFF